MNVVRTQQSGFTLVETIVVVAIFAILMIAVFGSVIYFYRVNGYTIAQAYEVSNARKGMEVLIRDIREMTFADDGTFPLEIMEDHKIGFYSDIDRDDSVEYVEYEIVDTTLVKRVYNAAGSPPVYDTSTADETFILSEYVQNLTEAATTFRYYDETGTLAGPSSLVVDIRYVDAQIIVNIDANRNPGQFMLRSSAALRNLKNNL